MKHSSTYGSVGEITLFNDFKMQYTNTFANLYNTVGSAIDLSIGYTSSPSWRSFRAYTAKTGDPVIPTTKQSTTIGFSGNNLNTVLTLGYSTDVFSGGIYQIGYGKEMTTVGTGGSKNIRFMKNVALKDLIFTIEVDCWDLRTQQAVTKNITEIIQMSDSELANYVNRVWNSNSNNVYRPIAYYYNTNTKKYALLQQNQPRFTPIFTGSKFGGVKTYIGSSGNPLDLLASLGSLASIAITKNTPTQSQPYSGWSTSQYVWRGNDGCYDYDFKSGKRNNYTGEGYLGIFPSELPSSVNVLDFVDKDQYYAKKLSDNYYGILSRSTKTNTSSTIYLAPTLKLIKDLLAGLCVFVTDFSNLAGATREDGSYYQNINQLIEDGHIWCGEMVGGMGTDRWLHSVKEIQQADNLYVTTENEDFNPELPPTPEGDDNDDIEGVDFGYYSTAGVGTLWKVEDGAIGLDSLTEWLMTQDGAINILNSIISVKEVPVSISNLNYSVGTSEAIVIGGHTTPVMGGKVSLATDLPSLKLVIGSFDIPHLSGTFLDYAPYSRYELVLPFAPSPIMLPDWVVGKTVVAYMMRDILTCCCQYVIECNGERICSVSGNFGVDKALSAQNVAVRDTARLQAQISTASSVIGGVMAGATGNIGGVASGVLGGVSALTQYFNAGKNNYMYTIGSNGDTSSVGLYRSAHIKVTRTVSNEDSGYNHAFGRPLGENRTLKDMSGFTVCENVDLSGISATEEEKNMIKGLLESGVYI